MPNPALSPEIQAAMQRRQGAPSTPALNQVSAQAPTAQVPQPMPQSQMTKASAPQGSSNAQPKFQPTNSHEMLVSALVEEMHNGTKLEKEKQKMSSQPAPAAPAPMGGGSGMSGFRMSAGYDQPMSVSQMQSNYNSGMGQDYSGMNNYGKGGGYGRY